MTNFITKIKAIWRVLVSKDFLIITLDKVKEIESEYEQTPHVYFTIPDEEAFENISVGVAHYFHHLQK